MIYYDLLHQRKHLVDHGYLQSMVSCYILFEYNLVRSFLLFKGKARQDTESEGYQSDFSSASVQDYRIAFGVPKLSSEDIQKLFEHRNQVWNIFY